MKFGTFSDFAYEGDWEGIAGIAGGGDGFEQVVEAVTLVLHGSSALGFAVY
jgi:hypothetical protein